ncbi:MAG TPA: peptidylprolyl isomerase [Chthoniobacterales bacterium]|nr:peptidylprolyl isomerase [Chthoniobacterales bacterium]
MKRVLLAVLACALGWLAAEWLHRSAAGREWTARMMQHVVALAVQVGLYEPIPAAVDLVTVENLRRASAAEIVPEQAIEHEAQLLRAQFAEDTAFAAALDVAGLNATTLRIFLAEHLRGRAWIEKQIAAQLEVRREEARQFYGAQRDAFQQPQRFRASHIFVAAPDGSTPDLIAAKQSAIQGVAIRLLAGEDFAVLAAELSEDEETKHRAGDLGYFSVHRMPPEFIAELEKLRVGELSAPVRSHLGFHLVRLTDLKPAREMPFEEVQPEITLSLRNGRRAAAVAQIAEQLGRAGR